MIPSDETVEEAEDGAQWAEELDKANSFAAANVPLLHEA